MFRALQEMSTLPILSTTYTFPQVPAHWRYISLSLYISVYILHSPQGPFNFKLVIIRKIRLLTSRGLVKKSTCELCLYTVWLYMYVTVNSGTVRVNDCKHHHHCHHLSLNREGRWGTTDDFATSFLHFSLFSTALWDLPNSRPVHSLMLSSHLFLCLPCLLPPFTVPCKMVLARPDEQEAWPYHCSLCLFTMVRRSSCGQIACWILTQTSSLVTRSLYEMCSILR